jgi:hypothetical protein
VGELRNGELRNRRYVHGYFSPPVGRDPAVSLRPRRFVRPLAATTEASHIVLAILSCLDRNSKAVVTASPFRLKRCSTQVNERVCDMFSAVHENAFPTHGNPAVLRSHV